LLFIRTLPPQAPRCALHSQSGVVPFHCQGLLMNDYIELGYKNRRDYLESLAEEYDRDKVFALAALLGPSEDFDGLVTALEDDLDY